jgi:hypothetical protein
MFPFCSAIGDRQGDAKASGNLGNTLKVLGKFDEAVVCCQRHLEIVRSLGDKVSLQRFFFLVRCRLCSMNNWAAVE